ncbi:MAG: hypothetical protein AMJ54_12535 [Deltaproteobacteria bacterium SG8_13]|nr:MAG: hypothetical protein AMJ54_12535 [Deltaproteobacteria bacterium SG8_13]
MIDPYLGRSAERGKGKNSTREERGKNMNPIDPQQATAGRLGSVESLFYRWFVQYNPLYFASALFFVLGVFLASKGMSQINWLDGQLLLTAVIECYEILLLAGSFILYRIAGLRRPAVILAVINICFLFDCTYQTEHISANPEFGILASFLWIAAFAAKLIALGWIFRLQVSWISYAIAMLAAVGVAAGPHLLYYSSIGQSMIHLAATWYGALLAIVFLWLRPAVTSENSPDHRCRVVLPTVWKAAWAIWGGFYLFHTVSWIWFFDIGVNSANVAPIFAVLPFISKKEEHFWVGLTLVMVFSLGSPPVYFLVAALCALIFFLCGAAGRNPRMYIGAIVCLHLALRSLGWEKFPMPDPDQFLVVLTIVSLLMVGWGCRMVSPFLVAIFGGIVYWHPPEPRDFMEWGALFIGAGFASLFAGVAANWWFRFEPSDRDKPAVKNGKGRQPCGVRK